MKSAFFSAWRLCSSEVSVKQSDKETHISAPHPLICECVCSDTTAAAAAAASLSIRQKLRCIIFAVCLHKAQGGVMNQAKPPEEKMPTRWRGRVAQVSTSSILSPSVNICISQPLSQSLSDGERHNAATADELRWTEMRRVSRKRWRVWAHAQR